MPPVPSSARTLWVLTFAAPSLMPFVLPPLVWPAKDPEDVLDYALDFTPSLLPGEAIGAAAVQVAPEGLVVAQPTLALGVWRDALTVVGLVVSAGLDATAYALAFLVTTTQGRVLHVSATLPVAARAAATVSGAGLVVPAQAVAGAGA